ncbi:MAG: TonB-dependent receptor [Hyphomonadaceae bacterium]
MVKQRHWLWAMASAIAMTGASAAHAQDVAQPNAPDAEQSSEGDEILVTAFRRSDNVQDVAASVDVISAERLTESGISTIEQLRTVAPGLLIARPPNNTASVTVRGLGSAAGPVSFDQSVSLFVDGVYAPRGAEFLSSLFDIERVEVVRGTQAAVLGKNTSLGGVLLTTRRPGREFSYDLNAQYEFELESTTISGGVDIPLSDTLFVRLAAQRQDLGGWVTNRIDGSNARETDQWAARISALWEPTPGFEAVFRYQYEDLENFGVPNEISRITGTQFLQLFTAAGVPGLLESNLDSTSASSMGANGRSRTTQPSERANLTMNWDLGGVTLTSVTGWSQFDQNRFIDRDYIPGDYLHEDTDVAGDQISQELRVTSPTDGRFDYMLGLLYVDNTLDQTERLTANYPLLVPGPPVPIAGAYRQTFSQGTTTWSVFSQLGFDVSEQFRVVGGLRFTSEEKSADMERVTVTPGFYSNVANPAFPLTSLSREEEVLDGSIAFEFRPSDDAMYYVSWGQGTKGGGYSDTTLAVEAEYSSEVAHTTEAGFKLDSGDGRWRFNAAAFYTEVDDYQNNFFNGQRFVIENLDIRSQGVELEGFLRPADGFELRGNVTYADTRNLDAAPGVGDEVPLAPEWTGQVGLRYETAVSNNLDLTLDFDVTYRSEISHQKNPQVSRGDEFATLNGYVGLSNPGAGWELGLVGRNLTDESSLAFGFPGAFLAAGNTFGIPEQPLTLAVQLRLFGGH